MFEEAQDWQWGSLAQVSTATAAKLNTHLFWESLPLVPHLPSAGHFRRQPHYLIRARGA